MKAQDSMDNATAPTWNQVTNLNQTVTSLNSTMPPLPPREPSPQSPLVDKYQKKYKDLSHGLSELYKRKLKPLEDAYLFPNFYSPSLTEADFYAKPQLLIMGQYSVGKTTFIQQLLGKDFPGCSIGPEPTTDRFICIMAGEERVIPGNAAAVASNLPFTGLDRFGTSFLTRFQVSMTQSQVLEQFSIVDTPGILSGEKQRVQRGYDFTSVIGNFASRSDMIILMFDSHKLDISDEFKQAIESLQGHEEKVKVILNKADQVDPHALMRIYGSLMWNLSRIWKTPETPRVYISSFIPQYQDQRLISLFDGEKADLFKDMRMLPRNSAVRKVNDFVKRARLAKVHALIISHIRKEMPALFGKESKKKEILRDLSKHFDQIARKNNLSLQDLPDPVKFSEKLSSWDFDKFAKKNSELFNKVDELLKVDVPRLMQSFPLEKANPPGYYELALEGTM